MTCVMIFMSCLFCGRLMPGLRFPMFLYWFVFSSMLLSSMPGLVAALGEINIRVDRSESRFL